MTFLNFDKSKADAWVDGKEASYIRRLFSITQKQGEQVKAGVYDGFEQSLIWAYTAHDGFAVKAELELIAQVHGLSKTVLPLALGLPREVIATGLKGGNVKYSFAVYIKSLAENSDFADKVLNRLF